MTDLCCYATVLSLLRLISLSFIALQDFVMGLSILLRGTVQEKLNWAFNLYDINKDGYITKEVMHDKYDVKICIT